MTRRACFLIIFLSCQISRAVAQETLEVDVCVYGGTSAGVIAAYTAQKLGKNTLLIEPANILAE
jgi:NADPH-dependent 2,4-dienoyl-CoA reductase/sulfur reductase-like enzyme